MINLEGKWYTDLVAVCGTVRDSQVLNPGPWMRAVVRIRPSTDLKSSMGAGLLITVIQRQEYCAVLSCTMSIHGKRYGFLFRLTDLVADRKRQPAILRVRVCFFFATSWI